MTTPDDDICRWFAGCARPAVVYRQHGILGNVPICETCNDILESWLDLMENTWHEGKGTPNPYTLRRQP